nr:arabinogalactan peptide 12 [Ipomoea batatas]GME03969.1 arabinogalactan peptide 12 [Ipomoea batatas]
MEAMNAKVFFAALVVALVALSAVQGAAAVDTPAPAPGPSSDAAAFVPAAFASALRGVSKHSNHRDAITNPTQLVNQCKEDMKLGNRRVESDLETELVILVPVLLGISNENYAESGSSSCSYPKGTNSSNSIQAPFPYIDSSILAREFSLHLLEENLGNFLVCLIIYHWRLNTMIINWESEQFMVDVDGVSVTFCGEDFLAPSINIMDFKKSIVW